MSDEGGIASGGANRSRGGRQRLSARRVLVLEREGKALELRKAGATFPEIVAAGIGFSGPGQAHRAVQRALDRVVGEPAAAVRALECERLDKMQRALWPKVLAGDVGAVKAALLVMERRARMLGLDAPLKRTIEVITHDAFSAAMQEVEGEIAELERAAAAGEALNADRLELSVRALAAGDVVDVSGQSAVVCTDNAGGAEDGAG